MSEIVNNAKLEFETYLKKWTVKDNRFMNGADVGCGTCRIDDMIPSIDQQADWKYAHAQFVHDCHDLEIFSNQSLDFIFSSHCLEDFDDIPVVFMNWFKKLKNGGLMLLLLPDMEICDCEFCKNKSRYPGVEDPTGNPSHKTNVGKKFMTDMLQGLKEKFNISVEVLQEDSIPHNKTSSIDFVIKKIKGGE